MRSKEAKKRQREYISKYQVEHYRSVLLRFRKDSVLDSEVIKKLDSVPNITEYVRGLIFEDVYGDTSAKMGGE